MELLTLQEAAKILKVTERTVYRYVKEGKLPAQKVGGGRWRIRREDLEKFATGEVRETDE